MSTFDNDTPGFLRDRLSNAQLPVDPAVWSSISSQLPGAAAAGTASAAGATSSGAAGMSILAKLGIAGAALLTVGAVVFALTGGWSDQTTEVQSRTEVAALPEGKDAVENAVEATIEAEPLDDSSSIETPADVEQTPRNAVQPNAPAVSAPSVSNTQPAVSKEAELASSTEGRATEPQDNPPTTHPAVQAETQKPAQAPQITFHTEISRFDGLEVQFMPLVDASNAVTWDFGDGQTSTQHTPEHRYGVAGEYLVTLTSVAPDGNERRVQQTVSVYPTSKVVLPNIFTPNGDGLNDVLYLHNDSKNVSLVRMVVLDYQGNMVFEHLGDGVGWDGTTLQGEDAPEGNYRLIVVAKGVDGQQYNESGIVRLQR